MSSPEGVIFVLMGILFLFTPVIEFLIKTKNALIGVKTEISRGTVLFTRIVAVIFILLGLLFLI